MPRPEDFNPADYVMCHGCSHVVKAGEEGPHLGMPALNLDCPRGGGSFYPIRLEDESQARIWQKFLDDACAVYATCPECGGTGRVRKDGKLVAHARARRPGDGRGRKPVPCEGSGREVAA